MNSPETMEVLKFTIISRMRNVILGPEKKKKLSHKNTNMVVNTNLHIVKQTFVFD